MRETQTRIRLSSRKMMRGSDQSSSRSRSRELSVHGHKTGSKFYPHDPLGHTSAAIKGFPAIRIGDSPSKRQPLNQQSRTFENSKPSLRTRAPVLPAIPDGMEMRGERLPYSIDQIVGNSDKDSYGSVSAFTKTNMEKASHPDFAIPTATPQHQVTI